MKTKLNLYKTLFLSTLSLSAFTVGGGYVIVPLMKKKFVDELGLLAEEEMLNMLVISQSSPGPIAVNASLLIGYRLGGILGAIASILGAIIPPLITITIISYFYNSFKDNKILALFLRGMQIGASALIINVVINMGKNVLQKDKLFNIMMIITAFTLSFILKINVIYVILLAAMVGIIRVLMTHQKIQDLIKSRRRMK